MVTKQAVLDMLKDNGFTKEEQSLVITAAQILSSDPDGAYSNLNDYGIDIGYDDIAMVCEYYEEKFNG